MSCCYSALLLPADMLLCSLSKADKIYRLAIARRVQELGSIKLRYKEFQARCLAEPATSTEPPPPVPAPTRAPLGGRTILGSRTASGSQSAPPNPRYPGRQQLDPTQEKLPCLLIRINRLAMHKRTNGRIFRRKLKPSRKTKPQPLTELYISVL